MRTVVIDGTITTVGPLSIRMPDREEYDGFPVMSRGLGSDGRLLKTGYLPATTLRGFLRRAVVTRDMRAAADAGAHYTLNKAYAELIGQDAESERQAGEIDLLEIRRVREESPVLDLFGSGLGVASRLRVGHFLPPSNVEPEVYRGVRKDLEDTDGVLDLLAGGEAEKYYGREDANRRRAEAERLATGLGRRIAAARRKGEDTAGLEAEQVEAKKLAEKYEGQMGDMQNSSRAIVGYHALPAGIELLGRIVITAAKDRDLEMLEYGFDCLSRSPVLGAQSARGCGEIAGIFDVKESGGLKKKIAIGGYAPAKVDNFSPGT